MESSVIKEQVKKRYSKAALQPEADLCCPTDYDRSSLNTFIPEEVLSISYGCGTPAGIHSIQKGERVLDIGSGGGIDCFIASKFTGSEGKVIGLDMTDEMLQLARRNAPDVAKNLGFASVNTEFRKGEAEKMPIEGASIDLIISNCVINLSPHKDRVFSEMFRVLRPGGRFTISDILTDSAVPYYLRNDHERWGACLTGALSVREYVRGLWQAGFRGLVQEKHYVWKKIDGIHFLSVTLTGYKLDPSVSGESTFVSLRGPFSRVVDEDGERFERGRPVRVEGDKARLFLLPSYRDFFVRSARPEPIVEGDADFLKILPVNDTCRWTGEHAMLIGPFREGCDDDHHTYTFGEPLEICSKTVQVLKAKAYQPCFCIFNRSIQDSPGPSEGVECSTQSDQEGAACC
jgi:arsenite methyltransferase